MGRMVLRAKELRQAQAARTDLVRNKKKPDDY
jgi:hypothetical protein